MTASSASSTSIAQDYYWMAEAIKLADRGRYSTSPNPRVGCILVADNQQKVGEGYHLQAGTPHAEVHALHQAGEQARGATAYVTLEPCSHFGRTPPCADALVEAGIKRVVVAMTDPNPQVSGRGIARLNDAGIEVTCDVMAAEAAKLNPGFIKRMMTGKPYVRLKLAISLDGKIALANGVSQWITGPEARRDVQLLRAASCAVLTGSGTARADNPSLLVRREQAQFRHYPLAQLRQPVRVVLDANRSLPADLQLFNDGKPTWRVIADSLSAQAGDLPVPMVAGRLDLAAMLSSLAATNINEVLVEAGPALAGALLQAGEVDELIVYQAPRLLGDQGRSMVTLPVFSDLAQTIELSLQAHIQIGNDTKLTYRVGATL